jgi:succinyl-CoA synthetase alpha subunit
MSILADRSTRVLVQGATGSAGRRQLRALAEFGTPAVAGVTPGRGDTTVDDVAIFDTVAEAVAATGATASIVHVPPRDRAATGAALEAIEAGLDPVVLVTEGVPVHETLEIVEHARAAGTTLVGPNCVGAIVPGSALLGMLPPGCTTPGRVGLISKSGSLAIEMLRALTGAGIGQSTAVSIGGDPVLGTSQARYLELFEADPDTDAVLVLGGGGVHRRPYGTAGPADGAPRRPEFVGRGLRGRQGGSARRGRCGGGPHPVGGPRRAAGADPWLISRSRSSAAPTGCG